jgi:ATP-dependent DNA helicase RecG
MLSNSIEYIKGVGTARAQLLQSELGIYTYLHLLQHYPFRYVDKTKFTKIIEIISEDDFVQLRGIIRRIEEQGEGSKKRVTITFRDESGVTELIFFKGISWVKELHIGMEYIIYGKPTIYNERVSLVHPEIELATEKNTKEANRFDPVYPTTEKLKARGLDSKGISRVIKALFEKIHPQKEQVTETLNDKIVQSMRFPSRYQSFLYIHFPQHNEQKDASRNRFKFEELFFQQLRILQTKSTRKKGASGIIFDKIGNYVLDFYRTGLKFDLTNAQKRVIKEIRKDLGNGLQMNRLLQGDVGSGKTIVAFMCMLMALDNGHQATLIAPTEILANQHFISIAEMAHPLGIKVGLLTGNIKGKSRKGILHQLETGELQIILGTHAILEEKVLFKSLGLAIIDEQHRFGVEQRSKMWAKNEFNPPHILVMTATPIPRTLAMTIYGDLDVSVIDEMPAGRKPITTYHKYESQRLWVFGLMKKEIAAGRQIYIVFPLIDESESETLADVKNLTEGAEAIEREFPKPQYQISIVHGQQAPENKHFEMQRFVQGKSQIMIATTVIEVGVNVPNATLMLIENAERFGLAQLHQLRGRVGRGGGDSFCILMTSFKLSEDGKFRMQKMVETTDGFKIAEADLILRGGGNIEGKQQSGILGFKIADLTKDAPIMNVARQVAESILSDDYLLELPENAILKTTLEASKQTFGFGKIS